MLSMTSLQGSYIWRTSMVAKQQKSQNIIFDEFGSDLLKTAACAWFIVFLENTFEGEKSIWRKKGNLQKLHYSFYHEILFSSKRAMSFSMHAYLTVTMWKSRVKKTINLSLTLFSLSLRLTLNHLKKENHTEVYHFLNQQNLEFILD